MQLISTINQKNDNNNNNQQLISQNSSSSINSIFDEIKNLNLQTQSNTSTITPIISRNGSIKQNNNFKLTKTKTKDEEFLKILNSKLNNLSNIQTQSEETQINLNSKLVVLLVGLPASGKSTICKQFQSYINLKTNYKSKIYNAGNIRRLSNNFQKINSNFFNPENKENLTKREEYAFICINNLIEDLSNNEINIGFFDATNTTIERRNKLINKIHSTTTNTKIIIFDIKCENQNLLEYNILNGKLNNLDYCFENDKTKALKDFKKRIDYYMKVYQPITTNEIENYNGKINGYVCLINGCEEEENSNSFEITELKDDDKNDNDWYFDLLYEFKESYMKNYGDDYFKNYNEWKQKYNK
ncbi:uncharacterized protein KGF55_001947 [Candida pseudojiufengensis]|uniref:uncharacterized protein n=1 Tax=Candida pseudojiufengensis TaxID=497109 RepID=UPI002223F05D|nr:uncharacterized protein KGF55_001947 [Candida pseudojiufengensis]KAI5964876.1 hypothetical protein KGF55_001947 [Candida pseudojiufengensis]